MYACTLGDSDSSLQAWIKKTGHTTIVFERPFVGTDPSLDERYPIPMQVVLQEVEDAADHQYGATGLQEEEGVEGDGVPVSSAGGVAGQAAANVSSLRVDYSGPMDALRKDQQAAESAAAQGGRWVASAEKRGRVGNTPDAVARKPWHRAATEACSACVILYVPLTAPCSLPRDARSAVRDCAWVWRHTEGHDDLTRAILRVRNRLYQLQRVHSLAYRTREGRQSCCSSCCPCNAPNCPLCLVATPLR